jgi:hypothetical protein
VTLKGTRKNFDAKVTAIGDGAESRSASNTKKRGHGKPYDYHDPGEAIAAVARKSFEVAGEPAESQSLLDFVALREGRCEGIPCRIRSSGS